MSDLEQIIEAVCEQVCDGLCKYPEEYRAKYKDPDEAGEHMIDEVCKDCPLNRLH